MQKIIEQLYHGEINICEFFNPAKKEPFAEAIAEGRKAEDEFYVRLPDDMKRDFELVLQNRLDATSLEYINMFSEGFRLGARMMLDILDVE